MDFQKEMNHINSKDFKLGEFIYMGMGFCNGHKVCVSVGYKIDYCLKKGLEFLFASKGTISFDKINKVKVGHLVECDSLVIDNELLELVDLQ